MAPWAIVKARSSHDTISGGMRCWTNHHPPSPGNQAPSPAKLQHLAGMGFFSQRFTEGPDASYGLHP